MIKLGPITTYHVDYDTALLATITCTFNNHYDWRVPTEDEWISHSWIPSWSWNEARMVKPTWTGTDLSYRLCLVRTIND